MRNFRQLRSAFVFAMFISAGMLASSPTLHAAGPSDKSVAVRCALLTKAINSAVANFGADSSLAVYLQGLYNELCAG